MNLADAPEVSWDMLCLVNYGRVYVFYIDNANDLREIIADNNCARNRVDTHGEYAAKYSDDGWHLGEKEHIAKQTLWTRSTA